MKKSMVVLAALAGLAGFGGEIGLAEGFANPPRSAQPQVWWHWIHGNVSKSGITKDFEAMKEQGINGVTMFDITCDTPKGPLKFDTPEWYDHMFHTFREAKRLGIEITLHNCSGWSSAGGPWVSQDDAMKRQAWSETVVKGGETFKGTLPQPDATDNYYRDVAVVAFPLPEAEKNRAFSAEPFTFVQTPEKPNAVLEFAGEGVATVSAVTVGVEGGRHWYSQYRVITEASDDGKAWKEIGRSQNDYRSKGLQRKALVTFPLAETTAKRYRVTIEFDVNLNRYKEPSGETDGTYKVTAVVLDTRAVLPGILAKTMTSMGRDIRPATNEVAAAKTVPGAMVRDLTGKMNGKGEIEWTAPAGSDWAVLRFGYTLTGQKNHPASATGVGYEIDKLKGDAMRRHMDRYVGKLIREGGEAAKSVKRALIDSYEVGYFNWTEGFEKRYAEHWKENLVKKLPVFTGRIVDSVAASEEVMWRFRMLAAKTFAEEYAKVFVEKCHEFGIEAEIQPYVSPVDDREYARYCDIPSGEFWPGGRRWKHQGSSRLAPSAGHFFGKRIVASEGFVHHMNDIGGRFDFKPLTLKAGGDRTFADGVNQMRVNSFIHQPWEVSGPGMTMGLWGFRGDRTQPWWKQLKPFYTYLARVQWMLQAGRNAADVLVYNGDEPMANIPELDTKTLNWDICGTSWLSDLKVENGELVAPSGLRYKALVLQGCEGLRADTRKTVDALAAAGAKFGCEGIEPDFVEKGAKPELYWSHRIYDDGTEGYFVASPNTNAAVTVECSFRQSGKSVELWDPETGKRALAKAVAERGGRTDVWLHLEAAGSVFVVFREGRDATLKKENEMPGAIAGRTAVGPWKLEFPNGRSYELDELKDWSKFEDDEIKYYSGSATYTARVPHGGLLELGDVRNFATVWVDGEEVATMWKPPFRCMLPKGGELKVKVTNLWPNRLIGDDRLYPPDCEWTSWGRLLKIPEWVWEGKRSPTGRRVFCTWRHYTKDNELFPSGLLGPVKLTKFYDEAFFKAQGKPALDYVLEHPEVDWLERAAGYWEHPLEAAFPRHWWTKGPQYPGQGESDAPGGRLGAKRREILANRSGKFDAVFIGDSITHLWEIYGSNVVKRAFGGKKILNIGNGNDRVAHTLWDCRHGLLDGYETPLAMLHIGTNNSRRAGSHPEEVAEAIGEILKTIREKQPKARVLLMPILPRGLPGDAGRANNERVNGLIRKYADGERVKWFDLRGKFMGEDGKILPGLMLGDNLHPIEAGYEVWAKELVGEIGK